MSSPADPKALIESAITAQFDEWFVRHPSSNKTGFDIAAIIAVITQVVSAAPAIIAMIQQLISIFKGPVPPSPLPVPGSAPVGSAPGSSLQS